MLNPIKDGLASILTARMSPWGDAKGKYPLLQVDEKQITTYFEAVNYLLKFYAMDHNIAKAISDISLLKTASNEISVQFADVLKMKVVWWENTYLDERTIGIFIDFVPANI